MKRIVTLLLVIVLITACVGCGLATGEDLTTSTPEPTPAPTPTPTPAPHEPTIALVVANQDFNYDEYAECEVLFKLDGYEIITASQQTGTAVSMDGQEAEVDTVISDLDADAVDALVVIGGSGATALYDDTDLKTLIQSVYETGRPVGAICLAPVALANTGLLYGKDATVYPDEAAIAALEDKGANYIDNSDVVRDGTIVTGNGPEAADDFAVTLLSMIDNALEVPQTP